MEMVLNGNVSVWRWFCMEIVVYLIVLYVDSLYGKGFIWRCFNTYIYGDGFILRWSYREMVSYVYF